MWPALLKWLSKGSFPLLSEDGVQLWGFLISELEKDAAGTVAKIHKALVTGLDPDDVFLKTLTVNKIEVNTGHNDLAAFIGSAHARLCENHGLASRPQIQDLIQRLRAVAQKAGLVQQSHVTLSQDPNLAMGHGLVTNPLTYLPDPAFGVTFGSVPDQNLIGNLAPLWNVLKRRAYETRVLTKYGGKPHYVLAHLLNHNLNGSGANPLNVVPFWAAANTDMAKKAEVFVKEFVLRGVPVAYTITLGAAVGMTTGRIAARKSCANDAQREIIDVEQHLPSSLIISCQARDNTGAWVPIVSGLQIDNYVPETVPYLIS